MNHFPICNIIYKDQPKYQQVSLTTAITTFQTKEDFRCFQFNHIKQHGKVKYTLTRMVYFKPSRHNPKSLIATFTNWQ